MPVGNRWDTAKNILCVRLDTIGDVLMTTPAIRALKESVPGRSVTLLTSTQGADVAALVPEIDKVIVYNAPWLKNPLGVENSSNEYLMADALRRERFDGAIIFTVYSQNPLPSAFLCYLADIPLRLAYCHENPYKLLTHWASDPEPAFKVRHEVQRQLDLVETIGSRTYRRRMSLGVSEEAKKRVQDLLVAAKIDPLRRWVIIHPGATAPSRRYPPEHFAVAARRLVNDFGLQAIFTGTEPERELIDSIMAMMGAPAQSLVGKLTIAEFAALIGMSPLLIANNTGPVHIAAALGVKIVDLYALTNPQHTPWRVAHRTLNYDVPCKYCYKSVCPEGHHHCLRLVSPASVVRAACELLDIPLQQPGEGEGAETVNFELVT